MFLRLRQGGTTGYQEAFDFFTPGQQCQGFVVQIVVFLLGHRRILLNRQHKNSRALYAALAGAA
ncbi:hypothetical protein D3C72_2226770 [compost metagenome]